MTVLDDLRNRSDYFYGLHFSISKVLDHVDLVSNVSKIMEKIEAARARRDVFAEELYKVLKDHFEGSVCVFEDLDVLALVQVRDQSDVKYLDEAYIENVYKVAEGVCQYEYVGGSVA